MNRPPLLLKVFLRAFGVVFANTVGRLDHYTEEHRRFLTSGAVCPNCQRTLMGRWWQPGVNCYDATGNRIPVMHARLKGRYFECPHCLHRWPFRNTQSRPRPPLSMAILLLAAAGALTLAQWLLVIGLDDFSGMLVGGRSLKVFRYGFPFQVVEGTPGLPIATPQWQTPWRIAGNFLLFALCGLLLVWLARRFRAWLHHST